MEKLLLSPEEAAEVLGVGRSRVYDLIRIRQLHSVRIGEVASGSGGRSSRLRRTLDRARRSSMNQRANGEGSIYRRSDGRWTAACDVLRPDGSRVRRFVYGKTRKDVADQLAVLIAKTKAGLPLAVESWTVERFAEHWLKHVVGPRLRSSTLSSYRETLRLHVVPTLGPVNLRVLTPTQVRKLLANKAADGLGARSVQIIHSTLRTMLSEAMREELIERNVATVVRPPSVERVEVQPWSTEEASRFLAAR